MPQIVLWDISRRFHRLSPRYGQVAHALRTLPPVAGRVLLLPAAPRLACVKPAASVHPEPGSNSSLYILYFSSLIPDTLNSNELTLSIFLFLGTCLYLSLNIFKELIRFERKGLQRYGLFLILQIFHEYFLKNLHSTRLYSSANSSTTSPKRPDTTSSDWKKLAES